MSGYGPPSVLTPVGRDIPHPPEGELVVKNAVIGVNRSDCMIRAGAWPQGGGFPYVPGLEACGTVERVGRGVKRFRPGDRVITMMQRLGGIHGTRAGGYQEYVSIEESAASRVPDGISLEAIGELGLPAVTALAGIDLLNVGGLARVLVHAGTSAVGQLAIQLARAAGAEVIATGTRADKAQAVRDLGAAFISTKTEGWWEEVGRVDRVFDLVGGPLFARTVSLLEPGGRLVFVGGMAGGDVAFSGWDLMRPVTITGYSSESLTRVAVDGYLSRLAAAHAAGQLAVRQLTRFPLAEAAQAHARMEGGWITGRTVLVPGR